MMKILMIILMMLLTACSGGGSSTETVIEQPKTDNRPNFYKYDHGVGARIGDWIYVIPSAIADSPNVKTGLVYEPVNEVVFYSWKYHVVIDGPRSDIEFKASGWAVNTETLPNITWTYGGDFGSIQTTLTNVDGVLTGSNSEGCTIEGSAQKKGANYSVTLALSGCDAQGSYDGFLNYSTSNGVRGAVFNDSRGFAF